MQGMCRRETREALHQSAISGMTASCLVPLDYHWDISLQVVFSTRLQRRTCTTRTRHQYCWNDANASGLMLFTRKPSETHHGIVVFIALKSISGGHSGSESKNHDSLSKMQLLGHWIRRSRANLCVYPSWFLQVGLANLFNERKVPGIRLDQRGRGVQTFLDDSNNDFRIFRSFTFLTGHKNRDEQRWTEDWNVLSDWLSWINSRSRLWKASWTILILEDVLLDFL